MDVSHRKRWFGTYDGLSLKQVGRVVRCGSQVANPEKYLEQDQLVFCFCPHASRAVVDQAATIIVPHGIEPQDAVYLPSVETALSLVQDAREFAVLCV